MTEQRGRVGDRAEGRVRNDRQEICPHPLRKLDGKRYIRSLSMIRRVIFQVKIPAAYNRYGVHSRSCYA